MVFEGKFALVCPKPCGQGQSKILKIVIIFLSLITIKTKNYVVDIQKKHLDVSEYFCLLSRFFEMSQDDAKNTYKSRLKAKKKMV